jgi:L-asparaginase/Glu-tRNA(Gln) amidotransferase subunit D
MKCKCKETLEKALDDIEKILQLYLTRRDSILCMNMTIDLVIDLKQEINKHLKEGD